jgi:citrate synthase
MTTEMFKEDVKKETLSNEQKNVIIETISKGRVELPIIQGTVGSHAFDSTSLKKVSDFFSYDQGLANTAVCQSAITYVDGDLGILRYRGYNIEDLANNCTFVEVAYLLIHGKLPTASELKEWSTYLNEHSMIHEDMHHFFTGFPPGAHPMSILSSMVTSLFTFYPHIMDGDPNFDVTAARLISKVRTIAAFSFKKSKGQPIVYPRYDLSYCANFLNMMFSSPVRKYEIEPFIVEVLNKLLILHADHEQNCSTTAVRLVCSARGNLYASISAGINALWGSLHGGANQAVIEMLEAIKKDGRDIKKYVEKAKNKDKQYRLFGFGHSVYKTYDPRAKIAKSLCSTIMEKIELKDDLLDIARELEEIALNDNYFVDRKLYPNIDFYTGIIYRALGIPTNMLTVMFAIGRLPGWIAQWKEASDSQDAKIFRPRQIYTGPQHTEFKTIDKR